MTQWFTEPWATAQVKDQEPGSEKSVGNKGRRDRAEGFDDLSIWKLFGQLFSRRG
jgi:hypothetical protein